MKKVSYPGTDINLYADASTGTIRPYVPPRHRYAIFSKLHNLSHPGIRASQNLMTSRFIWSGINKDVRQWTRQCIKCQTNKTTRHTKSPPATFAPPSSRLDHIHVDLVGPLPNSNHYRYILTCVDRFTRWPEATPITDIDTTTVAKAFISTWVARYGVPTTLTSDRGSQFESTLWNKIMSLLGIKRIRTTAYHPQSNGMVERFHRQLKSSIMSNITNTSEWCSSLPLVLLGIRTALKADLGCSSAELLYGTALRLPGELLASTTPVNHTKPQDFSTALTTAMSALQPSPPRVPGHNKSFVSQDLRDCTHVFTRVDAVKKPLQSPYSGPYPVIRRLRKTITINRNGKPDTVSIDRVKPAYTMAPSPSSPSTPSPPNQINQTNQHPNVKTKKKISFLLPRH